MGKGRKTRETTSVKEYFGGRVAALSEGAFEDAKTVRRLGAFQFDEGVEDEAQESYFDTNDAALAAGGFSLCRRAWRGEIHFVLEESGETRTTVTVRRSRGEAEEAALPNTGGLRRTVLAIADGLPLAPIGISHFRRHERRVYFEGEDIGTVAFDAASEEGPSSGTRRIEVMASTSAYREEMEALLELFASRMRDKVEPSLFQMDPSDSPLMNEPASSGDPNAELRSVEAPLALRPMPEIAPDTVLGATLLEASLMAAAHGSDLVAAERGALDPYAAAIARESFRRARLALDACMESVDEDSVRAYAKGLRRLSSLAGEIRGLDVVKDRFCPPGRSIPPGGSAFSEHLARLRGRAANDLLRHIEGDRYRKFRNTLRSLSAAPAVVVVREHQARFACPRIIGIRAEELLERFANVEAGSYRTLQDARLAVERLGFALEFLSGALGPGAATCAARLRPISNRLDEFSEAVRSAEAARAWLSGAEEPRVDPATALFMARSQSSAAKAAAAAAAASRSVTSATFLRSLALTGFGF